MWLMNYCGIVVISVISVIILFTNQLHSFDKNEVQLPQEMTSKWESLMLEGKSANVSPDGKVTLLHYPDNNMLDGTIESSSRGHTAIIVSNLNIDNKGGWKLEGGLVNDVYYNGIIFQLYGRLNKRYNYSSIMNGFNNYFSSTDSSADFFLVSKTKNVSSVVNRWNFPIIEFSLIKGDIKVINEKNTLQIEFKINTRKISGGEYLIDLSKFNDIRSN